MNASRGEYTSIEDWSWYCLSCGIRIGEKSVGEPRAQHAWMRYYRPLYKTPQGVKIGDTMETNYIWEDFFDEGPEKLGPWYPMVAAKPAEAYLFHKDCWILLSRLFAGDIDLDKLFEVCKDVSPYGRKIYYGDWKFDPRGEVEKRDSPLNMPVIEGLKDAQRLKHPTVLGKRRFERPTCSRSDPFAVLPMELRSQIAVYLSTSDFLCLREVSRSMGEIFWDQQFWKSRFLPCGDRGFLYCILLKAKADGGVSKDWRLIYQCTSKIDRKCAFLWQKRRQWRNNRWLQQGYLMVRASEEDVDEQRLLIDKLELSWQTVSTEIRCDRNIEQGKDEKLCGNCWAEHVPFAQGALLKGSVTNLAISILHEGDSTYITGIDEGKRDSNESTLTLGYQMAEMNKILSLRGKRLRGFEISTGEAGVHAIRAIFEDLTYSQWAGRPDTSHCRKLQVSDQDILALSGKFDYCRMVEFSIGYRA